MRKYFTIIFNRVVYTMLFVAVQLGALLAVLHFFKEQFVYFYAVCALLSVIAGIHVLNKDMNPAYKIAWLIPIMLLPIFGGLMYLMFGKLRMSRAQKRKLAEVEAKYGEALALYPGAAERLEAQGGDAALHAKYISSVTGVPPYTHTQTRYFPIGEAYFEALKAELEKAEKFILLEYFIINEGVMWDAILDILRRKAADGVEVMVMYDDLGCLFTLPQTYDRTLEKMGIKACVFHRFNSILNARFNTRDHRKICVIDGNVGFTGGINLADEYINARVRFGRWKDSGVMLRGEAVWSLTVMFLTMWDYFRREDHRFSDYAPASELVETTPDDGFVLPYTDTPYDDEALGETVYMNLINRARRYVYITTPYLVIDNEMLTALRTASKSGVDVRIIVPGVPDKKLVYSLTCSNFEPLLKAGVRIYLYTPGFIHAKNFVSDDCCGVVGTINLDYRSLYLHYECASWMYGSQAVTELREDFLQTFEDCQELTLDTLKHKNFLQNIGLALLRAFAPML